jgi:undecaprenyl-phosphate 4-deoxy-4-formamido-L-arabinose transferase
MPSWPAGCARGQIVMTMDDDLQHAPSDIRPCWPNWIKGATWCTRASPSASTRLESLGSRLNDKVAGYLMKKPSNLYLSPFRAMRAAIVRDILRYHRPVRLCGWPDPVGHAQYRQRRRGHHDRFAGDSGYSLRKSISLWLKMATNFSIVPLRLTSFAGLVMAGSALCWRCC